MISFSVVIPASSLSQTTPSKTPLSRVSVSSTVCFFCSIYCTCFGGVIWTLWFKSMKLPSWFTLLQLDNKLQLIKDRSGAMCAPPCISACTSYNSSSMEIHFSILHNEHDSCNLLYKSSLFSFFVPLSFQHVSFSGIRQLLLPQNSWHPSLDLV